MIKRIKSISKRTLALLLTMLMLISSGIVGAVAANVELAETGAKTFSAGDYIYLKNFVPDGWGSTTWITPSTGDRPYAWIYVWNSSTSHSYRFELVSGNAGASGSIYRAKIADAGTYDNFIITRNSVNTGVWNGDKNQTGDIPFNNLTYNCITKFAQGGTWVNSETYTPPVQIPSAPTDATVTVDNNFGGDGSEATPYLVEPNTDLTLNITGVYSNAVGMGYNVDYTASKVALPAGENNVINTTSADSPALGKTKAVNIYVWAYNGTKDSPTYSTTYHTETIYVKGANKTSDVTLGSYENGTVTTTGSSPVAFGSSITFEATPATGYKFNGWTASNTSYSLASGQTLDSATITVTPTGDVEFTPSFALKNVELNEQGLNLIVDPAGVATIKTDVTFPAPYFTPVTLSYENVQRGYKFVGWFDKDDNNVGTESTYTINSLAEALSYTAKFDTVTGRTVSVNAGDDAVSSLVIKSDDFTATGNSGTFYDEEEVEISFGSPTNYYVDSVVITETKDGQTTTTTVNAIDSDPAYYPNASTTGNHWDFKHTFTISGDLTLDVTYKPNPWIRVGTVTNGAISSFVDDNMGFKQETRDFTVTANADHYIRKVYLASDAEGVNQIGDALYDKVDSSYTTDTFNSGVITQDTYIIVVCEAIKFNYISLEAENIPAEDFNYFYVISNSKTVPAGTDGKFKVEQGAEVTITISEPVDSANYVTAIAYEGSTITTNSDETSLNVSATFNATAAENSTITVTYASRPTYTVTVNNADANMGTLDKDDQTGLYKNDIVVIKPTAKNGYVFNNWTVDGTENYSVANDGTITIIVDANIEITANWDIKSSYKVTLRAPASKGWAQVTGEGADGNNFTIDTQGTQNWVEVNKGATLTFTATPWDSSYEFEKFDPKGEYSLVSNAGGVMVLTINGDVTVDTVFKQGIVTVYANGVPSGYGDVYLKHASSNGNVKMNYDSDNNRYYYNVPADVTWIDFMDSNNNNYAQVSYSDGCLNHGNTMNITTGKGKQGANPGWTFAVTPSSNVTTYDITGDITLDLENYGDGIHIGTIEVPSSKGSSISVNILGSDSIYWNFRETAGENSAYVVKEGASASTKVAVNLGDNSNGVTVDFAFNPIDGTLSWTVVQMKETVNIKTDYGMNQNEADPQDGKPIGKVYFKPDGNVVYSYTEGDDNTAKIAKGEMVTIYSDIVVTKDSKPIHRIEGWVVDGKEFISASSTDGIHYFGSHTFNDNATITPIYFHTNEWLDTHGVDTVTVFAVLDTKDDITPDHQILNWQDGITSYTWFYPAGTKVTKYCQFDEWTGQYMIPVVGSKNTFKTYVETSIPKGSDIDTNKIAENYQGMSISGITFADKFGRGLGDDSWYQAYDYYEFKSLIDKGRFNITFVLNNHNSSDNSSSVTGTFIDPNNGKWQWTNYVDYSGNPMDIYRNVTKIREGVQTTDGMPDNTLYIVRAGAHNTANEADRNGLANGEFYIKAYVYDASGELIDSFLSYELVDPDSTFFTNLKEEEDRIKATYPDFTYVGGTVMVSYEAMENTNADRYDGEWYGDLTDTTQVRVRTYTGFTSDNGKTFDVNFETHATEWGTATVNDAAEAYVTRGNPATLLASAQPGYKFIGWYNTAMDADGNYYPTTLLTTDSSKNVEAGTDLVYIAVYRVRGGGEFDIKNEVYIGNNANPDVPYAHGGESYRSVSVKQTHINGTTTITEHPETANGLTVDAKDGDILEITIYTDAFYPDDTFYAWYMEVRDENGVIVNFEEVAVSKDFVGSKDKVSFTFTYEYKEGDSGITVFSDIEHKSITKDIIYVYQDRYNNTKQYVKTKYTLVGNEIFEGVPSEETVIKYAPWVEDLYKDTQWIFDEDKFTEDSWTLVATQQDAKYDIVVWVEDKYEEYSLAYNELFEIMATSIDANATNNGYWYNDKDGDGEQDADELILAYGTYYGLRVTSDATLRYVNVDSELEFNISLDIPVYGREQSGADGAVDKIYVDYNAIAHVPYFVGNTLPNGETVDKVIYEDKEILSANSPVTFETLEANGYDVKFGFIFEQLGTFKETNYTATETQTVYDQMLAAAIAKGYGTAHDDTSCMDEIVALGKNTMGIAGTATEGRFYINYDLTNEFVSNKNRFPYTMFMTNDVGTRGRFFNVYAYVVVTDTNDNTSDTYYSNMQTLNIYETGNYDSSDYK